MTPRFYVKTLLNKKNSQPERNNKVFLTLVALSKNSKDHTHSKEITLFLFSHLTTISLTLSIFSRKLFFSVMPHSYFLSFIFGAFKNEK